MDKEKRIILFWVLLIIAPACFSQNSKEIGLDKYKITCFTSVSSMSPDNIIRMDNNGQILLSCVSGKTVKQFDSLGITYTQSQLQLLVNWDLLFMENDIYTTAFPIIKDSTANSIRSLAKFNAREDVKTFFKDIDALSNILKANGRAQSIYTILFSYVLDDLVWRRFQERSLISKHELSIEHPYWSGVVWAIYPPRTSFCGTNSISDKGVTLSINWSRNAAQIMGPLGPKYFDYENIINLMNDYAGKGRIDNKEAIKTFAPYNIFDASGNMNIPIIDETTKNMLATCCTDFSYKIADNLLQNMGVELKQKEYNFKDASQFIVVYYHEYMWELLDCMGKTNVIQKPIAFSNPEKAKPKDIGNLVFIVKRNE